MFYQEKEIDEVIQCPRCKNRYNDPRILPCGLSMCYNCILSLDTTQDCMCIICICAETHPIPTCFIKNAVVAKLAEKKASEVYRGAFFEDLRKNLKKMKQKMDDVTKEREYLEKYVDGIRMKVGCCTEEIIDKMNISFVEVINQFDEYQIAVPNEDELKTLNDFFLKWSSDFSV
jgi:hypothetical protein